MKNLIFTSTTCFRRDFKITDFIDNVSTLLELNNPNVVDTYVVVNEYSEDGIEAEQRNRQALNRVIPNVVFIQKRKEQYGQAHSLNIISKYIHEHRYQLHWEEAWECRRPFIELALNVMENTSISQLGFTDSLTNEKERMGEQLFFSGHKVQFLTHKPEFDELDLSHFLDEKRPKVLRSRLKMFHLELWPLYTLRPSLNRTSFVQTLPKFNTDLDLWPVLFELLYALHWSAAGGVRAALLPAASHYSHNYRSTWRGVKSNIIR